MSTRGIHGLEYVKMFPATKYGLYPDFNAEGEGFKINAIVKDSASFSDTAPSTTNIEIEDSDLPFATIETDKGSHGFTLQTYDMGEDAYKYLLGYAKDSSTGWLEEGQSFVLPNQAIEIKTQQYGNNPAVLFQWANCKCVVSKTGTIGKSGFANFQLEFTQNVNRDKAGNEISGARRIEIDGTAYYSKFRKKDTTGTADSSFVFLKSSDNKYYTKSGDTYTVMSAGTTNLEGGVLTVAQGGTGTIVWE